MSSQRDLEEVRKRLSAFAATVPDHGLERFGELVEILSIQTECVYEVTVETEYEERTLLRKDRPTDEQADSSVPSSATVKEVNVWGASVDHLLTNGHQGTQEYEIAGSQEKCGCDCCGGHGSLRCQTCKGKSKTPCPNCRQRG